MADPKQIPQLASELYEMSRDYLRQEAVDPLKKVGTNAGLGVGGAVLLAVAATLAVLGLYALAQFVLPATAWYNVLARGITAVVAALAAGLITWRLSR